MIFYDAKGCRCGVPSARHIFHFQLYFWCFASRNSPVSSSENSILIDESESAVRNHGYERSGALFEDIENKTDLRVGTFIQSAKWHEN